MTGILPSDAVAAIEKLFPELRQEPVPSVLPDRRWRDAIAALAVLSEVPSELIQLSSSARADLAIARAKIDLFTERGKANVSTPGMQTEHLVTILTLLKQCPDQLVPPSTTELLFITDADLRESLRIDIAEVERAITDGEWKSATVVCGSIIEALLLWKLGQQDVSALRAAWVTPFPKKPFNPNLDEWGLHQYIEVAAVLDLVEPDDTVRQIQLAKDFRNLIHPGRSNRLARKCDRPTALAAVAGLGFLVRDLDLG